MNLAKKSIVVFLVGIGSILALDVEATVIADRIDPGIILPSTGAVVSKLAGYELNFSWSDTVRQDNLTVTESGWVNCYLWGNFPVYYNEFFGVQGDLLQTSGIQAHRWRYLLNENSEDIILDPEAVDQQIGFFKGGCSSVSGEQAMFEFDVYIDTSLIYPPDVITTSVIGLRPPYMVKSGPDAIFRIYSSEECGDYSVAIESETRFISVHLGTVANEKFSFGSIKAMYR